MIDQSVAGKLAARIAKDGSISIADYMDVVAEAYYSRDKIFGREGDFITAPEISQIFGELIGLWCVTAWQALDQPRQFNLVECGPGRGTLMADALRAVTDIAAPFIRAASIHLLERSPNLRKQQQETLYGHDIEWHNDLSTLPDGPMIIVGNEFLDALPIRQFEKVDTGWCERLIDHGPTGFSFVTSSFLTDLVEETFDDAPIGSILELSEAVQETVGSMARLCTEQRGVALMIDYGHAYSEVGDTLQAVRRHAYHPVLDEPGIADLTAHVDFAAVTEAARTEGAQVCGPVEQGLWLRRLGIVVRQAQLSEGRAPQDAAAIQSSVRRLIEPDGMGALFKVIALAPPDIAPLAGFEVGT